MSYWAAGCCLPVNLWFVPCPGSPDCAGTFFATTAEWSTILGKTPSAGDVYKYDDGSRENPCVYCGKFQEEFAGGQAPPTGGFEKQDDCDDDDCPKPYYFFNPCNEGCNTYKMAATKEVWDSLLGITIDPNNPSSYAGTWLFTRTDGDPCCYVNEDGDPDQGNPCHKFCGTLSAEGDTANLCFDSSNANTTPQCEKCSPTTNQVQVIGCSTCNSTGALSFQLKANGCTDPTCLSCKPQECKRADGTESRLIYKGRKTISLSDWNIKNDLNYCQSGRDRIVSQSDASFDLQLVMNYTVYMQGNTITGDINSDPPILSRHTKDPCITIDDIQLTASQSFEATTSIQRYSSFNETTCGSGNPISSGSSYAKDTMVNPTFSLIDSSNPVIKNSWLEKRIGLQRDAIGGNLWYECEGDPSPNNHICPEELSPVSCVMNFMTCGGSLGIPIRIQRTDKSEFWLGVSSPSGEPEVSETAVDNFFYLKLSTGMLMKDALELCCCDDIPTYDSMYYTDFPELSNFFATMSWKGVDESGLASDGNSWFRQWKLQPNGERYFVELFDDGNPPSPNAGNPVDWDYGKRISSGSNLFHGPYLDKDAKLGPWDFNGKRNFACNNITDDREFWEFDLPEDAKTQDVPKDNPTGTNERTMDLYMSISDTLVSLECIADDDPNLPGSGCEDGVIDVP